MLVIMMLLATVLLYLFYRTTSACCRLGTPEGLQQPAYLQNRWSVLIVSFLLTAIYLPLSTMAMHVLVWSDDLWIVPNPYVNATSSPPGLPLLGPTAEYRDPLDFCWTTTMKRNELNYAPVVVLVSAICVVGVRRWYSAPI